jgi:hypothetical protein
LFEHFANKKVLNKNRFKKQIVCRRQWSLETWFKETQKKNRKRGERCKIQLIRIWRSTFKRSKSQSEFGHSLRLKYNIHTFHNCFLTIFPFSLPWPTSDLFYEFCFFQFSRTSWFFAFYFTSQTGETANVYVFKYIMW